MYIVPPLRSTMPMLWLAPKVWLQGSQSSSTGRSRPRKRQVCASICWLAHSMRWVLITTLGAPVEPDVSRYLASVSGVMARNAARTAGVSAVCSQGSKACAPGTVSAPRLNTRIASGTPQSTRAGAYTAASDAYTSAGSSVRRMPWILPKSPCASRQ